MGHGRFVDGEMMLVIFSQGIKMDYVCEKLFVGGEEGIYGLGWGVWRTVGGLRRVKKP